MRQLPGGLTLTLTLTITITLTLTKNCQAEGTGPNALLTCCRCAARYHPNCVDSIVEQRAVQSGAWVCDACAACDACGAS